MCRGFGSDGRTRCFHAGCHECKELEFPDAGLVCPCAHFETDGKPLVAKEDGKALRKSGSTPLVPKDPMIELLREFKNEFIEVRQGQQSKSHTQHEGTAISTLKMSATMEFPKGSADALMDLDAWLREFDRVVAHLRRTASRTCCLAGALRRTQERRCAWTSSRIHIPDLRKGRADGELLAGLARPVEPIPRRAERSEASG